jgi:hypothetical protein
MKMPRTKKSKGPLPLEDLPGARRMALVRLMARYNIDLDEAYEKLAVLADQNSRIFDEAVKKRAESLYKSRAMTQMNAARVSINKKANAKLQSRYDEGYDDGYVKGRDEHAIYYYCNECQKPLYIQPNSEAHQAVVDAMYERGWGHADCHNKKH